MAADAKELEALYRRRHGAFLNGLAPIAGSYELARDAVQETFVRALKRRRGYRGEGSLEAWVWRIAIRTAIDQRQLGKEVSLDQVLEPIGLPEPERDPELARALASLPPRRRLIVFLRYFADLSYADIASACGIDEGTVAAALAQGREALASRLEHEGVRR
jgi:RNA polymerase sigma-70 factor (ECF subfamily)